MIQEVKSYNAKCDRCGKVLTIDRPFSSVESMMNTLRRDGWKVVKPVYPDMQTETYCPDCIKEIEKPKDSKPLRGGFAEEP